MNSVLLFAAMILHTGSAEESTRVEDIFFSTTANSNKTYLKITFNLPDYDRSNGGQINLHINSSKKLIGSVKSITDPITIKTSLNPCEKHVLYLSHEKVKLKAEVENLTSASFSYNLSACPRPASSWAIVGSTFMVVLVGVGLAIAAWFFYRQKRKEEKGVDNNPMYGAYYKAGGETELYDRNVAYYGREEGDSAVKDNNHYYTQD
jgi:hypothetical protein